MALLALIIGAVLIVSAIRNTHGELFGALMQDVPAFAVWGAAIFGLAVIGFIPGLKPVSRGLLALVLVVIVLTNYQNILGAFEGLSKGGGTGTTTGDGGVGAWLNQFTRTQGLDIGSLAADAFGHSAGVNGG